MSTLADRNYIGWLRTSTATWVGVCAAASEDACWKLLHHINDTQRECIVLAHGLEPHPHFSISNV